MHKNSNSEAHNSSETLEYTSSSKSRAISCIGPAVRMCDVLMRSSRVDCSSVQSVCTVVDGERIVNRSEKYLNYAFRDLPQEIFLNSIEFLQLYIYD